MDFKHMVCPCCNKEIDIPLREFSTGFDFNYSILINSTVEFYDLVDICPECGYTMLFDNGISDEMKEYVQSEVYQNVLKIDDIEEGLKKWILYAILCEADENYTEAGIAYTKAYDYLELKEMSLDKRFIEKAASCFLSAASEYTSFNDAILAVDALRRDGEMAEAKRIIGLIRETFEGELVDNLVYWEDLWVDINDTGKTHLDI